MKAKEGERQCRAENEPEMGTEVCGGRMILWWAQIIERRLCENVVWPIGVLQ
jgi:hypothetical protein